MPTQNKAYRRVVRNDNGIGLRIAYFDAVTGEEITDLTGYILLDQGVGFDEDGTGGDGDGDGDSDSDNDNDGGGSGSSRRSSSDYDHWDNWYANPNVSRGSGDIIGDLQAALESGRRGIRDTKLNAEAAVSEALGGKVSGPGYMPRFSELEQFKTGATSQPSANPNVSTPNTGSSNPSYDSTVGAQPNQTGPDSILRQILDRVPGPFRPHFETLIKESQVSANAIIGDGSSATIKKNLSSLIDSIPKEVLERVADTAMPEVSVPTPIGNITGSPSGLANIPLLGGGIKNAMKGQLNELDDATIQQGLQQYRQNMSLEGGNAPVPANKTERIKELQNSPNVQAATKVAEQGGNPLQIAEAWLGYKESDPKQAAALSEFFTKGGVSDPATGGPLDPAKVAWCAAWLNGVLFEAGIEGTGSATAKSFLDIGEPIDAPEVGSIVVFDRGAVGSPAGHVGIVAGVNPDGSLQVLGGNQNNSVNIQTYGLDRVEGFRKVSPMKVDEGVQEIQQASAELPRGQTTVDYINPNFKKIMDDLATVTAKPFDRSGDATPSPNVPGVNTYTGPSGYGGPAPVPPSDNIPGINTYTGASGYGGPAPAPVKPPPTLSDVGNSLTDVGSKAVDAITQFFGGNDTAPSEDVSSYVSTGNVAETPVKNTSVPTESFIPPVTKDALKFDPNGSKPVSGAYSLNDSERQRFVVQTILGEAAGEGVEGMLAVANVIKNRVFDPAYPADPRDVVLQPKQFSPWNPVSQGGNNPAARYPVGSPEYNAALKIAEGVFNGNLPDNTFGAVNFHTTNIKPYWADEANTNGPLDIGNHRFYPTKKPDVQQATSQPIMNRTQPASNPSWGADTSLKTQPSSGPSWGAPAPSTKTSSGLMSRTKNDTLSTQPASGPSWGAPVPSTAKGTPSNSTLDSFSGSSSKSGSSSSSSGNWYSTNGTASQKASINNSSKSTSKKSNASSQSGFMSGPSAPKTQPSSGPSWGSPAPTTSKTTNTSKSTSSKTSSSGTIKSNGTVKQTSAYSSGGFIPGGK